MGPCDSGEAGATTTQRVEACLDEANHDSPVTLPKVGSNYYVTQFWQERKSPRLGGIWESPLLFSRLTEIDVLSLEIVESGCYAQNCYRHHAVSLKTKFTHNGG